MTAYLPRPPHPGARVRLVCFPYAGGGASAYARWQRGLTDRGAAVDVLPVRLPGREGRAGEPRFTDLTALTAELDENLSEVLDRPYLLYGHSMGALIAYELMRSRQTRGARLPRAALLAAYRAPHLPPPRIGAAVAGDVDGGGNTDAELAQALADLGGLPPLLLDHPEWLRALLPVVRDDLALCAGAVTRPVPVSVPLHLFAGRHDELAGEAEVAAWHRYGARDCELHTVPGGHFFLRTHEEELLDEVARVVRRYEAEEHTAHPSHTAPRSVPAATRA